jgi:hypothetical protein
MNDYETKQKQRRQRRAARAAREDAENNRLCIHFDQRASKELYAQLRSRGFAWSPTRSAFVRKISNAAIHWATHIVGATT